MELVLRLPARELDHMWFCLRSWFFVDVILSTSYGIIKPSNIKLFTILWLLLITDEVSIPEKYLWPILVILFSKWCVHLRRSILLVFLYNVGPHPISHRFIAGSSKCLTKPLSILLTTLLYTYQTRSFEELRKNYSRSGINQMWVIKNKKKLLEHLQSPNFNLVTNIKSFDFSTLYTTIPLQKFKKAGSQISHGYLFISKKKKKNRRHTFFWFEVAMNPIM